MGNLLLRKGLALTRSQGGGAAGMPAGALGIWYGDKYSASPRPHIPNEVAATAVSPSRAPASRRLFNQTGFYTKSSLTITDANVAAEDGSISASTLVGTGNWLLQTTGVPIEAGTWRVRIKARSQTGMGNQAFRMSFASMAASKTLTETWQVFTHDVVVGSPTTGSVFWAWSPDGTTGATFEVEWVDYFLVSEQPPADLPLAGHMYVGAKKGATDPAYADNALHYASGGYSVIQFPAKTTLTAFTAVALVEITGATAGSNMASFFAALPTFQDLTAAAQALTRPTSFFGGAEFNGARAVDSAKLMQWDGLFDLRSKGYHAITVRCTGTKGQIFVDDILAYQSTITTSSRSLWDYVVAVLTGGGANFGAIRIQSQALYPTALNDAEVRQAVAALRARAQGLGLTADLIGRVVVADGDSITGREAFSYPYKSLANLDPWALGINVAVGGDNMIQIKARKQQVIDIIPPNNAGRSFVYTLLTTNDMAAGYNIASSPYAGSRTAWLADVFAHCDDLRAAGYKVGLVTITPRNSTPLNANFSVDRAWANGEFAAAVGTHCDFVVPFAANSAYGDDADAADVAKYSDGTHPTTATQTLMEVDWRTAVNAQ